MVDYVPMRESRSRGVDPETAPGDVDLSRSGKKRDTSRWLSNDELKLLYKPKGFMPALSFEDVNTDRNAVVERVRELDYQLKERVEEIFARFGDAPSDDGRCCSGCKHWLRQLYERLFSQCGLGVVSEILPTCFFYLIYNMFVIYWASQNDWDVIWTATKQDNIYYPAIVLAFLLCFRASGCMDRYKEGMRTAFEMQKTLREVAFEVITKVSVDEDVQHELECERLQKVSDSLKKKYLKHEFRRLCRLLFACAARDLNDSALEEEEPSDSDASRLHFAATEVEYAAIRVTHSAFGHAFRVYLVAAWLLKTIQHADAAGLLDGEDVSLVAADKLNQFKEAWMDARQVAYTGMPFNITHLLWTMTTVMNMFMPWALVTQCRWTTWFPSLLLTISFYGILQIANAMENPFGFDAEDIQIWEIADHLDEEVCLTMHYAVLDEVGGENLYRGMMDDDLVFLGKAYASVYGDEDV